jgi:hypothetical protein
MTIRSLKFYYIFFFEKLRTFPPMYISMYSGKIIKIADPCCVYTAKNCHTTEKYEAIV